MTTLDYYNILRLKSSATPKDISYAYRDLSILYRDSKDPTTKEIMGLIDEANLVLSDARRRTEYDLEKLVSPYHNEGKAELSKAERIIDSWGSHFNNDEREYIDKIHAINKLLGGLILILAIIFLWSVIASRWDISMLLMFGLVFLRKMVWSIYTIKILLLRLKSGK